MTSRSWSGAFTNILLEVEIPAAKLDKFSDDYFDLTGNRPIVGDHVQIQENKFGIECRMYFNADASLVNRLRAAGFHVELLDSGYRSQDYSYRVNSKDLFWDLVSAGYRLGSN